MAAVAKLITEGTVKASDDFDADRDARHLCNILNFSGGADAENVIYLMARRTNQQRQAILKKFEELYRGKTVKDEFKKHFSGILWKTNYMGKTLLAMMDTPREYDAEELNRAIEGKDEMLLVELLYTRSNEEVQQMKAAYESVYKKKLGQELAKTSGRFRKLIIDLAGEGAVKRSEISYSLEQRDEVRKDAEDLKKLVEQEANDVKITETIYRICLRSKEQLRALKSYYKMVANRKLEEDIQKLTNRESHFRDAVLSIIGVASNQPRYFAERIHKTMEGWGIDEYDLIRLIVTRSEIDMVQIKEEYRDKYNETLTKAIEDNANDGFFDDILLALIAA